MYMHAQIIQNVGHALCLKCQSLEITKLVQVGKSPLGCPSKNVRDVRIWKLRPPGVKRNGDTSSVGMLPINKSGARNYHNIAKTLSRDRVEKVFGRVETAQVGSMRKAWNARVHSRMRGHM